MKQKILSIIMVIVVAFNTIAIPASAETLTLSKAIGSKAAVITVDDEGFAKTLQTRYNEDI